MEWFFGNSGFENIDELKLSFNQKTISIVNEKLESNYQKYSPWMSNLDQLSDLGPLFLNHDLIISTDDKITTIERHYLTGEDKKDLKLGVDSEKIEIFNSALSKINSSGNDISKLFGTVVDHIVPINTEGQNFQEIGIGFSTHLAKGSIFLSIPTLEEEIAPLQMAINAIHELGHQCLYLYQSADKIIDKGLNDAVYSYVRKTKRPAIQSFHASVALAFMMRFLTQYKAVNKKESDYQDKMIKALGKDFKDSLRSFDSIKFTEVGGLIFKELRSFSNEL
jgi:hypothetical protein